jgi:tetratricopeptide (TPR) repeat protein
MNRAERRRQAKLQESRSPTRVPAQLASLLQEAVSFHRAGRLQEAEQLYRQILSSHPRHAETLHMLGLLTYQASKLDMAADLLSKAVAEDSSNARYFFNLGVVRQKQGHAESAAEAYRKALGLDPNHLDAQGNLGNLLLEQGRLDEAATCHQTVLGLNPRSAEAHNNLGVVLKEQGRLDEAVASYRRALGLKPDHLEALCNLGSALMDQDRLDEAVASFQRAISLRPDYVKAHSNLGFAYLWQQRPDAALASFRKAADLWHNHGRPVALSAIHKSRIKHEVEQLQRLLDRRLIAPGHEPYLDAWKRLRQLALQLPPDSLYLSVSRDDVTDLSPSFNRILYYADCPPLPGGALNQALDVAAIEARYNAQKPEVTYIDDLLRPEALDSLRRFCMDSTIWKKDYVNGYVGAFLGEGFSCPLFLQLAEELRARLPGIFKGHRLMQAWSFKCDSQMKALNLHADAAAVNVNFWITPDEANLDQEHGGLIVWDKEAPKEWNFKDYNSSKNEPKVRAFLRDSGAKAITIPYRQNRAIVFNSDLFHESQPFRFKDDYESRRVNITLLYGRRK